jgi:hypothetical protein
LDEFYLGVQEPEPGALQENVPYYGVTIGKINGLTVERTDETSKVVLNSDFLKWQIKELGEYVDRLYFDAVAGDLRYDGLFDVNSIQAMWAEIETLITSTFITQLLSAQTAYIAQLTVDELNTSDKVQKYLDSDTSDVNYIKAHEQNLEFVTATTDGLDTEQVEDRDGNPIYWIDEEHTGTTTEETSWPVLIYVYEELTKLMLTFELVEGTYLPKMVLGAGSGVPGHPEYGRGYVWKGPNGTYIDYYHSSTGELRRIMLTDDGIDFSESVDAEVIFTESTALIGVVQIWVDTDEPESAKEDDLWADKDNPTVADGTRSSGTIVLTWGSDKHLTLSGTSDVTLPDPSSDKNIDGNAVDHDGIVMFCIKNDGIDNDLVTLDVDNTGTIDGESVLYLFPGDSITVRNGDGKNWEVV